MTKYERELQDLKPHDEVQGTQVIDTTKGYAFITTAGHGYLVVPVEDKNAYIASAICQFGFVGALAYYLEEDKEAGQFLQSI